MDYMSPDFAAASASRTTLSVALLVQIRFAKSAFKAEHRFRSSHELTCPEPAFDL